MPWTLYRYILREVLAILILTTAVLVTVLSFFMAIKPMSEGLLDAYALVRFVLYTMPTVLGFALPFAGAFATTLVFIRMTGDNEITACCASGLSYLKVLAPVIALGLVLTMGLFYLSNFVVPGYYKKAARLVEGDLITMMVSQLDRGLPFKAGRFVIYADSARQESGESLPRVELGLQPAKLIVLDGVAAGQIDDDGRIRGDMTAERAAAYVYHHEGRTLLKLMLRRAIFFDAERGQLEFREQLPLAEQIVPNPFEDKPEFMSYPDLQSLKQNPERYTSVGRAMERLQRALASELLLQELAGDLGAGQRAAVTLEGPLSGEQYTLAAPAVERVDDRLVFRGTDANPVRVGYARHGQTQYRIESDRAVAEVATGAFSAEPSVYLELTDARVIEAGPDPVVTEQPLISLPRLSWPMQVLPSDRPGQAPSAALLRELSARPQMLQRDSVRQARAYLGQRMLALALKVTGQKHTRAASAVACLLLMVLGALMSIRMTRQMPLVVYFWTFVLAVVTLVLINSSSNVVTDPKLGAVKALGLGLPMLWSGNVLLALVIGRVYCKVARN